MRYKKIVLSVIANVLCLGLLNGCGGYSHDLGSGGRPCRFKSCYPHEQTIVNLDFFEIYSGFLFLTESSVSIPYQEM